MSWLGKKAADVIVSGQQLIDSTITAAKLVANAVTYAKIQQVTAGKVLGRDTSGNGVVQELPIAVDASGKVGIGTSAPGCSLQVEGGIRARGGAPGSSGANNNGFAFATNGDNDSGMFCLADGQLDFFNNNAETVRINSLGDVIVGDVAALRSAKLNVITPKGSGGDWNHRVLLVEDSTTSTDGQPGIGFHAPKNSSAAIFKMYGPTNNFECRNSTDTGFVAILASAFTPSSDYRVKSNVENIESTIEKVLKLRPVSYEKEGVDGIEYGLIAHEAAEHFPHIVRGEKDAMRDDGTMNLQTVNYMALTAVLTKAIQEQQAIIAQLQADVALLKGVTQ